MPRWTPDPPPTDLLHAHRIVRTPADKPFVAIVTSTEPVGCITHFANGRTSPCEGPGDCALCEAGHSGRWHGYVGALQIATLEHVIFEYTAPVHDAMRNYHDQHQTLRGCGITAHRPSKTPNGRVVLKTQPVDQRKWNIPDPPDLHTLLCHIWGIALPEATIAKVGKPPAHTINVQPSNGADRRRGRARPRI